MGLISAFLVGCLRLEDDWGVKHPRVYGPAAPPGRPAPLGTIVTMAPTADSSAAEWLMQPMAPEPETFASMLARPAWMARAACRGEPPEAFFGQQGRRGGLNIDYTEARRLCASCPVRAECLEFAVSDREPTGFWGGTTTSERMVLRQRLVSGDQKVAAATGHHDSGRSA